MSQDPVSEDPVRRKLRERGAAAHLVQEGADGLVARWRQFVSQVESGYPHDLDEYRNDLDLRSLISATGLDREVAAEDLRLRAVLQAGSRDVWESDVPEAFWVKGYPRNAQGPLLDDLRAEGIA